MFLVEHHHSGEYMALRANHGGYLVGEDDGRFHSNGSFEESKWRIEHVGGGAVALKAHNTSWFLGISMFGHVERVDSESYDRCHFKMEVMID